MQGLRGKIGEQLFTGKWRFTPISLEGIWIPTPQNTRVHRLQSSPRCNTETLFVLTCRVKNGQKKPMEMFLTSHHPLNTALTDDQEHSYAPLDYDAHNETGPYGGPVLLPGAAAEFAVIFSAPKGTTPKDVIFTIASGDDWGKGGTDVRISVQK